MKGALWAALSAAVVLVSAPVLAQQGQGKAGQAKATGETRATWWGHAAWVVETPGGARIAIDPWLKNPLAPKDAKWPEQLDAILLTHGHSDHVGDVQALAKQTGAPIYGSFELVALVGGSDKDVGANIGGTFRVKDATIHLVEAVHSSGYGQNPKEGLKYGGNPMGYVIQIDNGPTLYHAGDTAQFASMAIIAERLKPTVAMLPIGGHFTMDPDDAAAAARVLGVKTVIPMHYGTFPLLKGTPEQLGAALKTEKARAKMVAPKPGETITLSR